MRWVCPHCTTTLETAALSGATLAPGPRPGWSYARCFQCDQFAMIELATANAVAINSPAPKLRELPTPPPFTHTQPPPASVAAPEPVVLPEPVTSPAEPELPEALPELPSAQPSWGGLLFCAFLVITGSAALISGLVIRPKAAAPIATAPRKAAPALSPPANPVAPAQERLAVAVPELSDSLHSTAMAPRRPRPDDIQLYLQARRSVRAMELRTGPGVGFPLFGLADLDERYPVLEVKDRWFKVQLEETPGLTAWVAYEHIELFSKDKVSEKSGDKSEFDPEEAFE